MLIALLAMIPVGAWAQTTFTQGDFTYTVTDEENHKVSIAKAEEATLTGALVIPSSVTYEAVTYAVTAVGESGFNGTGITSVTIPVSVMTIGNAAFQNCGSLSSITIEDSETPLTMPGTYSERPLWNSATTIYLGRNLTLTGDEVNWPLLYEATSVELGPKVTTINPYLFSENSKLENLTIGSGVTTIGEYAFNSCGTYWDDETHQGVENLVVTMGSNVTSIGAHAFENCSTLKSIALSSTLTTIGNEAFYLTGLTSISIPASVTSIGDRAFQNCDNMTSITIEDSETPLSLAGTYSERPLWNNASTIYLGRNLTLTGDEVNWPLLYEATSVELGPKVTTINPYLFSENSKLENLTIGSGVTTIGEYAFNSCGTYWDDETHQGVENLVVTMGSNVTSIGAHAFENCSTLKSIALSSTLTTIGNEAFYLTGLTSISIPASVTSIGDRAFQNCDNMTSITIEDSETPLSLAGTYSERPLWNNASTIYIGRNLTLTGDEVNWSLLETATSVEFGPQVTAIPNYLFSGGELSSVKVPWLSPISLNATTFSDKTYANATLWIPGGTMDAYEAANNWKEFVNKDFASYVVSITASAHGTLAVADISSTNGETATTLIDRETDAVFTVTPATGYELKTFTVNGEDKTPTEGSYTVSNLLADQTVVAGFTPITYTLTYDLAKGSVATANPATYTIETATFTLKNPTREGYNFAGWTGTGLTEATTTVTIAKGSTGERSYTATWTPINYDITLTLDGGTATNPATYTIESDDITLNNPTKTGYTFKGWTGTGLVEPTMEVTIAKGSKDNRAYTATWQINQYTISFNSNGGSTVPSITQDFATAVTAPADPTREGYTFTGWNQDVPTTIPAENVTLTAQWTINQYTITFNTGGGSAVAAITQDYNTAVTAPAAPTKTGYTFAGWTPAVPTTIPAENVTVTAQWQINQYTITFNTDGGTNVAAITQDYGTAVTTPADPTKTGYTFAGWTPALPATIPAEDITVKAQWTINTYSVSITGAGVTADNMNPEYLDDVVITIAEDPDRTLTSLKVNGEEVKDDMAGNTYTIESVAGNVTVVATFASTKEFISLPVSSDMATFSCSQALDFTGMEGLKAYIASGFDGTTVLLTRVEKVPANTGLLLLGTPGATYKVPYAETTAYYSNLLKPVLTATTVAQTDGAGNTNYLLGKQGDPEVIGFYKVKSEGSAVGAQKAYLQLPSGAVAAGVKSVGFYFDDTTAVEEVPTEAAAPEGVFDIHGRKIPAGQKLTRGIYVINGKKVSIK